MTLHLRAKRALRERAQLIEQQAEILQAVLDLEPTLARRQSIVTVLTRWANDALLHAFNEQQEAHHDH